MGARTLAAALLALSACTFGTSSTVPAAKFGYGFHGVRVALLVRAGPLITLRWREALAAQAPIVLAEVREIEKAVDPAAADAQVCQVALDLARAGQPVDEVVVVDTSSSVEVYDGRTCRPLRTPAVVMPRIMGQATMEDLFAAELYPSGLAITGVSGRQIVAEGAASALAPGAVFIIRGHAPGPEDTVGRLRVAARRGDRVTFEAERDLLGVGPGDELRRQTRGHQWTGHLAIIAGALRTGRRTSGLGGAKFALRWEPQWLPLFVETELALDNTARVDIAHAGGGLALGLRWPRGAFRPYAVGELGLVSASQLSVGGDTAYASGTYLGAGLGAQKDFQRWFLLADARWRRISTGTWESGDPPSPIVVGLTERVTAAIIVAVAAGYRF
jgi:hypothetical protein